MDTKSNTALVVQAPAILLVDNGGIKLLQPAQNSLGSTAEEVDNVVIDTITYDEKGEVAVSGRGSTGEFVRLYIDDKPIEITTISVGGLWTTPLSGVSAGVYTLRVDEVSTEGLVISRVETPFQRETVSVVISGVSAITVQPGYTLWAIAREKYGSGFQYVRVYNANRDLIKNPDLIYPGQVLTIPGE